MPKALIVHCKRGKYDVYIGRGKCPKTHRAGPWGNPFHIGPDGTRAEVVAKHLQYVKNDKYLMSRIHELRGKVLGCWCEDDEACHGDNLVILANSS